MKDRIFRPRVPVPEPDPVRSRSWGARAPAPDYSKIRWRYAYSPWLRTEENCADLVVVERVMGYDATRHLLWTAQAALHATSDDELESLWSRAPRTELFRNLRPDGREAIVRLIGHRAVCAWLGLPGSRTVTTPARDTRVAPALGSIQPPRVPNDARESAVTASAGHETTTRAEGSGTEDDMSFGNDGNQRRPGATTLTSQLTPSTSAAVPGRRTLTQSLAPASVAEATPAPAVQMQTGDAAHEEPAAPVPSGEAMPAAPRPTLGELFGSREQVVAGDHAPLRMPAVQMRSGDAAHDHAAVQAAAAHGVATSASPLPHRDDIQRSFGGHDISGIQAHVGSAAAASAAAMGARAYATGDHVVLGNSTDLHTAAHEAAHVVQQRGGVQLKGGVGQAGDVYEQHADAVADAVVAGRSAESLLDPHAGAGGPARAIQRSEAVPERTASRANADIVPPVGGIDKTGFIDNSEGAFIRTGPREAGGMPVRAAPLPPATRVFATGRYPGAPDWIYVTAFPAHEIVRGYVQGHRINFELPEPLAELRQLRGGETVEKLAKEKFGHAVSDGHDLRYYENVLLHVNKGRAGISGAYQDPGVLGGGANNIQLHTGHRIWLVSAEFAKTLEGIVPSGSFTGGAVAKARRFAGHVEDILHSVTESRHYLGEVAGEYAQVIREHQNAIFGIVGGFLMAEAASALLAATPTGVTQIIAVLIQLTLSALGAAGMVEAGAAAMQHGAAWLATAWTANGKPEKLADASREFIKMLVSLAMAALSYLGAKGNYGNAVKIASSMPTGGLPALAVVGGGQMGAGAGTRVLIGPSTGSFGVGGAMMSKVEEERSSESEKASKTEAPKSKAKDAAPSENSPATPARKPASRHTLKKVTQSSVAKDLNTVVEPRVNVAADVEAINDGKAIAGMTADGIRTYTVNGRTYGMEAGGTLFPMTGDGFILLNRNAYKILGIFNKFGDTPRALEIIELQRPSAKFTDADIENARTAWRAGQGGVE